MTIGGKKIPAFVFVFIIALLIAAISVPTIILPYYNNLSEKQTAHDEATEQISKYETALIVQTKIQDELNELQSTIDSFNKVMYIDADAAIADIQKNVFSKFNLSDRLESFSRSEEQQSELVTKSGKPFYCVDLTIKLTTTKSKILDFLKYIETEAGGYYYVKSVDCNTVKERQLNTQGDVIAEVGDLSTTLCVSLYYLKDE